MAYSVQLNTALHDIHTGADSNTIAERLSQNATRAAINP
jgi:hypothetical protein